MSTNPKDRAWLEVRADALLANLERVRAVLPPAVGVLPMVKADAYGLGLPGVVRTLEPSEPFGFGVATVDEALQLRALGVGRPVTVLSPTPTDAYEAAVNNGVAISVGSLEAIERVAGVARRWGRNAEVHLEVDTGMGRAGVDWKLGTRGLARFREALSDDAVHWAGIFTHLHSAEDDPESIQVQLERFGTWTDDLGPEASHVLRHVLNSAGVFHVPEFAGDLVRPGIFLYGGRCGVDVPAPEPVVSLRARVVHVRDAEAGTTLGYGSTHIAEGRESWATLAVGYGDGLPRALGNRGYALLRGRRVPIVGRISMDVAVVNITGQDGVSVGDVATLVGRDGPQEITLDEVASWAGTISYEVLTGFTSRLPRVWEGMDGG